MFDDSPVSHTRSHSRRTLAVGAVAITAAAVLVACQPALSDAQAAPATTEPPVALVARVAQSALETTHAQVARVEASQRVDLQPRVSGPVEALLRRREPCQIPVGAHAGPRLALGDADRVVGRSRRSQTSRTRTSSAACFSDM